mgnify:CR=1 FL=1
MANLKGNDLEKHLTTGFINFHAKDFNQPLLN